MTVSRDNPCAIMSGMVLLSSFFNFLQPHVQACVSHNINEYTQHMSDMETAQILFQLAYVLNMMRDESSLTFLVQCIRLRLQDRFRADEETALQIKVFTG